MNKKRFDLIGATYELAITKYPQSRTDHKWLIKKLNLEKGDRVLEITAGTGFLTSKIAPLLKNGELIAEDTSQIMLNYNKKKCQGFNNVKFCRGELFPDKTDLPQNYFDKAVCLGGFHHLEDQINSVRTVFNKLKKGGIFCIGDFADCSRVQKYFDERINNLTLNGHQGLFLTISRMVNIGRFVGFKTIEVIKVRVPFYFNNEKEIGEFYRLVHGLNQKEFETLKDIKKYIGIKNKNKRLYIPMDYIYTLYYKE